MPELYSTTTAPKPGVMASTMVAELSLLERILPLWTSRAPEGGMRPSLVFGEGQSVLRSTTANLCDGVWQLHLFSFSYEARQAQETMRLMYPDRHCEVATRPNGEGMFLVRVGDGAFQCRILDRRAAKSAEPLMGSWECSQAVARQAALHIPAAAPGRARQAARHIVSELLDMSEKAELCAVMGCKFRLNDRPYGQVRLDEVMGAANDLLEQAGLEVTCSDRQVLSFIDSFIAKAPPEMGGLVDRMAHELVAELSAAGGVG
ncbi:hypothetical protein [Tabrizicola sp.]|uniref:hypothetical protein n=1 Tax=Tabrizicola sp. TaxID=2005166 RepID=UPI0035AE2028